ncbi:MAG: hypothetical protein AMXMBFR55_32520 [Gemmatimonadota bacterium]
MWGDRTCRLAADVAKLLVIADGDDEPTLIGEVTLRDGEPKRPGDGLAHAGEIEGAAGDDGNGVVAHQIEQPYAEHGGWSERRRITPVGDAPHGDARSFCWAELGCRWWCGLTPNPDDRREDGHHDERDTDAGCGT